MSADHQKHDGEVVDSSALLACPFCGITDKEFVSSDECNVPAVALHQWPHSTFCVQCEACGCSGPMANTGESAAEQWNTRKQSKNKQTR